MPRIPTFADVGVNDPRVVTPSVRFPETQG